MKRAILTGLTLGTLLVTAAYDTIVPRINWTEQRALSRAAAGISLERYIANLEKEFPEPSPVPRPKPGLDTSGLCNTGNRTISPEGLDLIKQYETFRANAYKCPSNTWTIGFGHTENVKPGDRMTYQEALKTLDQDTSWAQETINDYVRVPLNQNQYDALTSLTFNIGRGAFIRSTLLKELNSGDYQRAADQFLRWNKADGQVLPGLQERRIKERIIFTEDSEQSNHRQTGFEKFYR
jgi:lysozyme